MAVEDYPDMTGKAVPVETGEEIPLIDAVEKTEGHP